MKILNPVYDKLSIVKSMSKGSGLRVLGSKVLGSGFKGSEVQDSNFKGSRSRVQGKLRMAQASNTNHET